MTREQEIEKLKKICPDKEHCLDGRTCVHAKPHTERFDCIGIIQLNCPPCQLFTIQPVLPAPSEDRTPYTPDGVVKLLDQAFDWIQPYLKKTSKIASEVTDNKPTSIEWMIADQYGDIVPNQPTFTLEGVKK
jgi:hypothetical protein